MRKIGYFKLLSIFYPSIIFKDKKNSGNLYLTFDDGPTPGVTEKILEILDEYKVKATFFCIGKNAESYPELLGKIKSAKHSLANHTYDHVVGWKNQTKEYIENITKCEDNIPKGLFRPPYGKLKPKQIRKISRDYKIVLWDVNSKDYDANVTPDECLENVKTSAAGGSIILFHDSLKSQNKVIKVLPLVIKYFQDKKYNFQNLEHYRL